VTEPNVFVTQLKLEDHASGPVKKIGESIGRLPPAVQTLGDHMRGLGKIWRAAFGEVEGGAEEAREALRKLDEEAKHAEEHEEHVRRLGHAYERVAAHFSIFHSRFVSFGATLGDFGSTFAGFLPLFGPALAGFGVFEGFKKTFEGADEAAEHFSELGKAAGEAGMSVERFQQLQTVGTMADIGPDALTTGMFYLNRTIGDAQADLNKNAAGLFKHLGISLKGASADNVIDRLADAFEHTHSEPMKARMAEALFGRGGKELIPLLSQGSEELHKLSKEASKVDFTPSREQLEKLEKFHHASVGLGAAWHGLTLELGTDLAPRLEPVVRLATNLTLGARDFVATPLSEHLHNWGSAIERIALTPFIEKIRDLGARVRDAVGHFKDLAAQKLGPWADDMVNALERVMHRLAPLRDAVVAMGEAVGHEIAKVLPTPPAAPAMAAPANMPPPNPFAGAAALLYHTAPPIPWRFGRPPPVPLIPKFYGAPPLPELSQSLSFAPVDLPSLYGRPASAEAAPGAPVMVDGKIRTEIVVRGLPPESSVSTTTSGLFLEPPDVDVGHSMAGVAWGF
jgi:hypothetical protein